MADPTKKNTEQAAKGGEMSTCLGRQVFVVLKDVLVEEMVEENSKLGKQNNELEPVGTYLNSKIYLHYLGKKIMLDLKGGKSKAGGHLIPISDVAPVPLLDLAQNSLFGSAFSGIFSGLISLASIAKKVQVEVRLGRISLGSLETELGGISSAKFAKARNIASRGSFLELSLSSFVRIYGHLKNVSDEDVCGGLKDFNEQINARLIHGIPHVFFKNETSITFTLKYIYLTIHPGLLDVVLDDYGEAVCKMPETILRRQINDVLETEEAYRELLDQNVALNSTNRQLLATRKWLSRIEFTYCGGSTTVSVEDGRLAATGKNKTSVFVELLSPEDFGKMSSPLNNVREVRVTLGGLDISEPRLSRTELDPDTGRIYLHFGPVIVVGGVDVLGIAPEDFQWPGNNAYEAILDCVGGQLNLSDNVVCKFIGVSLECSHRRIAKTVEILGMSEDEELQSIGEST